MPPKAQPRKGVDDVDLSDINTLPEVRDCNIYLAFSKFKSGEVRQKLSEHVKANLPEHFKPLSREAIVEYGKAKGYIEEDAGPDVPPKDGALTYE